MFKVMGILRKRLLAVLLVLALVCALLTGAVFGLAKLFGLGLTATTAWELCVPGICTVLMLSCARIYHKKLHLFLNVGCTRGAWFAAMQLQKLLLCAMGAALALGISYGGAYLWNVSAPIVPWQNHIMVLCCAFVLASLGELVGAICAHGTRMGLVLYMLPAAAFGAVVGAAIGVGVMPMLTGGYLVAATEFLIIPCAAAAGTGLLLSLIAWLSLRRCEAQTPTK